MRHLLPLVLLLLTACTTGDPSIVGGQPYAGADPYQQRAAANAAIEAKRTGATP